MIALMHELSAREAAGLPDPLDGTDALRQTVSPTDGPDGSAVVELALTLVAHER